MKVKANNILFPDAHSYGANSKLQEEASIRFLNSHKFIGDESVLDIGCGTGRLANIIAERVPNGNVTGIDNSPAMIELAKQKHSKSNLTFMLMDADDI